MEYYKVIEAYSSDALEEIINELAQQGYEVKTHTSFVDTSFAAKHKDVFHTVIMERY